MTLVRTHLLTFVLLAMLPGVAWPQNPQAFVQRVVDVERSANKADHSMWSYHEDLRKPKEHLVQWVASTPGGDVCRVVTKDEHTVSEADAADSIQKFLRDSKAQKKEVAEREHDGKQVDDFLALLPAAFLWTETGTDGENTLMHFEPDPKFHPPTREARVFAAMAGDMTVNTRQLRIRSMKGHLMREVSFGGGLLGKLKEGGTFSLDQEEVGKANWQLTATHVDIEGSALLFHSVSLRQDDVRSAFERESDSITLEQGVVVAMKRNFK
ncbi:hypothetical protein [Granulicella sibirica]|uniref:Uncharacterized protein n=1 Tax=Granulicella sibirica TaxID=2479048 RepID=A0A4Q0T869_9BACT|nr:hypothetical protein [Granulicella sibirica]RXH57906.1 hypothetical protein GRAN_1216 [Granulicella sibirica]